MVLPSQLLKLALLSSAAWAHDPHDDPEHQSLPKLLDIGSQSDLELQWLFEDNIQLDSGRLVIGPGSGGIWSIAGLANSAKEWTMEIVVRSSGDSNIDLQHADTNGLALWLLNSVNDGAKYLGGPQVYDGLSLVLNNKDNQKGLKVFANDGSKAQFGVFDDSVGNCNFNYLDSNIPFSIRVSYSAARNWFKIQIDNSLCFKTDVISIPNEGDLRFGVTANAEGGHEVFEVLKFSVWSHLTKDAIDDHLLMGDGEIVDTVDTSAKEHSPAAIRQSLMERTRVHQQEMQNQAASSKNSGNNDDNTHALAEILANLDGLNDRLDKLNYDLKVVRAENNEDLKGNDKLKTLMDHLNRELDEVKNVFSTQLAQLLAGVKQLNEKVIGEVREQQGGMDEITRKVDLLMSNHKEISYKYAKDEDSSHDRIDTLISQIKYISYAALSLVIYISFVYYRLTKDIKRTKLL